MDYPLRHISIRVPWHDTGWDGRVCAAPRLKGACLKLKRIAEDLRRRRRGSSRGKEHQGLAASEVAILYCRARRFHGAI